MKKFMLGVLVLVVTALNSYAGEVTTNRDPEYPDRTGDISKEVHANPVDLKHRKIIENIFIKLSQSYPDIQVDNIGETHISGLYEIVSQNRVAYYHNESGTLFVGMLISSDRKNLTAEKVGQLLAKKIAELPLDNAIKIGNGKNIIIEFSDIDCPFCRKFAEFVESRTDITRYVFLTPMLQIHPEAYNKSLAVLCNEEPVISFTDAVRGSMDNKKIDVCDDPRVIERLATHMSLIQEIGIKGTPTLIVNGTRMDGFDQRILESLLNVSK